jgi:hypothetical protein
VKNKKKTNHASCCLSDNCYHQLSPEEEEEGNVVSSRLVMFTWFMHVHIIGEEIASNENQRFIVIGEIR